MLEPNLQIKYVSSCKTLLCNYVTHRNYKCEDQKNEPEPNLNLSKTRIIGFKLKINAF